MLGLGNVTGAAPYLSSVYSQRAANANLGETDALRFMMARAAAPLAGRRNLLSDNATAITVIAFSDDDAKVVTALDNGDLWTWDAATGQQRCGVAPSEKSAMI